MKATAAQLVRGAVLFGCSLALATLSACGTGDGSKAEAEASAHGAYTACNKAVAPLVKAEQQMDDRLDVGMQFADYTSRLGDVSVAYKTTSSALTGDSTKYKDCIAKVGLQLEHAFNDYTSAGNTWNDCITDSYCDFSEGSAALRKCQAKWAAASKALASAKQHLADLDA